MPDRVLHLCLPAHLRRDMAESRTNILSQLIAGLEGWQFHHHAETATPPADGYALLHMREPAHAGSLCLRRAYHYPFWRIEATNERWRFDVAQCSYAADAVPRGLARAFFNRFGAKVLGADAPAPTRQGHIFMPLQGRLTEHRSFQAMSPLAMITATLSADRRRKIFATLHPSEVYTSEEIAALDQLSAQFPRFQRVTTPSRDLLLGCDYVVTQNSGMALTGFFARKPAVLFAKIDFHHIAGAVVRQGVTGAFATAQAAPPDFAAYLYWFFKQKSLNAAAADAPALIRARLASHGWPVG